MCGTKKKKQKLYNLYPHPAAINLLVDTSPIAICVKCVKRELGTKNLEELHELEKVR